MKTETETTGIPPDILAELDEALLNAMTGKRDPEVMRQASERMDQMREELRQQVGELNIAVDLIREVRNEE